MDKDHRVLLIPPTYCCSKDIPALLGNNRTQQCPVIQVELGSSKTRQTEDTTSLDIDIRLVMTSKESSHGQVIVDATSQGHWAQDSCLIGHDFWDFLQELELLV